MLQILIKILMLPGYDITSSISVGPHATDCGAVHETTNSRVTIRVIEKSQFATPAEFTDFQEQIKRVRRLDHPLISTIFDIVETSESLCLVMEPAPTCLRSMLARATPIPEKTARHYFCEIVSVLDYLHNSEMVYRDLSIDSVHFDDHNNVRLVDLGLAGCFDWNSPAHKWAPESDVFALGKVLLSMCVGSDVQDDLKIPDSLSEPLVALLRQMLEEDPAARISLDDIMADPWFKGYDLSDIMTWEFPKLGKFNVNVDTSSGLDFGVLQRMTSLGFKRQTLVGAILEGKDSVITTTYRLLRKQKVAEEMAGIGQGCRTGFISSKSEPLVVAAAHGRRPSDPPIPQPRSSTKMIGEKAFRNYRNSGAVYFKPNHSQVVSTMGPTRIVQKTVLSRSQLETLTTKARRVTTPCPL